MIVELVPSELSPFPERFPDFVRLLARRYYEIFGDRVTRVVGKGDGDLVAVMVEIDGQTARHRFNADVLDDSGPDDWDEPIAALVASVLDDLGETL